jgi:hypothetical protein
MIKLFRKIRQKMLTESKFNKYLLYAIGEIILVVVGILIALQINNSNDLRKENTIKQTYYNQLIADIDKDSIFISKLIVGTQEFGIDKYQNYLELFKEPELEIKSILERLDSLSRSGPTLIFNDNTVETLIYSGDINLMPIKIRNGLLEMKRKKDVAIDAENTNFDGYLTMALNAYQKGYSELEGRLENQTKYAEFLKLYEVRHDRILIFEGALSFKNFGDKARIQFLKKVQNEISALKKIIQSEIK